MSVIHVRGLKYSYPDGHAGLRGVDLEIANGESLALIGPNGAGKTTLLLHLAGILAGDGGVRVLGVELGNGAAAKIRGRVGLVFQDPTVQLFCPTVQEDVEFGPMNQRIGAKEVSARAREALEMVGLAGYEQRAPHHLSVGEQKLAALATVLSMRPEILAMDEPSANLDPRARREMIALLGGLRVTKVIASHDLDLVSRLCGRTVVLKRGTVAADGPTARILGDAALLEEAGL